MKNILAAKDFVKFLLGFVAAFLGIKVCEFWFYLGYLERGHYAVGGELMLVAATAFVFIWVVRKIFSWLDESV